MPSLWKSADPGEQDATAVSRAETASKAAEITRACQRHDIDELVRLADSPQGLLSDSLRCSAWPILLGWDQQSSRASGATATWRALPRHRDEDQVQLDVNRAFAYYPTNETEQMTNERKSALSDVIVQTLRQHPMLCYFQGYHDIVQVLLLVLGPAEAATAAARLSLFRIRDFMLPTLEPALRQLTLLPAILAAYDAPLAAHLSQIRPYFALAATLTLYAHDIQEYGVISRLFDFILAHEPVISIYLFAAIIISKKDELLEIPLDEPDMLHFTLSKLPQNLDLETIIARSLNLFENHPPQKLPGFVWWKIPSCSVLKTSRSIKIPQSPRDGEMLFAAQSKQLRREELRKQALLFLSRNRRPIASVSAALLFGVLSVWLRRGGQDRALWSQFYRLLAALRS